MIEQMEAQHPDLYHSMTPERFRSAGAALLAVAPSLSDAEFLVEVMRLAALPTLGGRDGHSGVFTMHANVPLHALPLRLYDFRDGLFVVDALPSYEELVGARVVGVDGTSLPEIRRRVAPLITRDNPATVKARFPTTFGTAEVLEGLGISRSPNPSFVFENDGRRLVHRVEPISMDRYLDWVGQHSAWRLPPDPEVLYLSRLDRPAWVTYLPENRTIYMQYNETYSAPDALEKLERMMKRGFDRVVLDIRHNGGGDNTQYGSLLALLSEPKVNRRGRLFVIAGRTTFSAAGNLAGRLDHDTQALFVGESPGGSPNQFGDQNVIELPHSGIDVFVADYFVEVVEGDDRAAIPPDIPASLSSTDFFEHRDPAMEAVLSY